jgi:hypothetical protein
VSHQPIVKVLVQRVALVSALLALVAPSAIGSPLEPTIIGTTGGARLAQAAGNYRSLSSSRSASKVPNTGASSALKRSRSVSINPDPTVKITKLNLPGPKDSSVWFSYYTAGEDALLKGNEAVGKQYLVAALATLETREHLRTDDPFALVRLSALEKCLSDVVEGDAKTKRQSDSPELEKALSNRASVLARIAALNVKILPAGELLRQRSAERAQNAKRDLLVEQEKAKTKDAKDADASL